MGVWIETTLTELLKKNGESHPVWVCGLKQIVSRKYFRMVRHTLYGCVD